MTAAVRRSGGRAVGSCLALLLTVCPPDRLSAQVTLQPSLGFRYTSTLVHDSIVSAIAVRPALAPALALTAATPIKPGWSAEATVDFSWSHLARHEAGATVELGGLSTLAVQFGFRRQLPAGLSGRFSVGGLKYLPSEQSGIFRAGAGGVFALGGAAVSYVPAALQAGPWAFGVEARYDVHQFITGALRSQGFTSSRTVHRVMLALSAARVGP
ncbi:MAG TPA: hypothetical protein VFU41_10705 [Gemmatimonadales bacterium]|nr:hypothetical protein [Gemmatimonadales bacterium]